MKKKQIRHSFFPFFLCLNSNISFHATKAQKSVAILFFATIAIPIFCLAQTKYPEDVEKVLLITKTNRPELEKALNYFYKSKDPLKIKAINFLIANMDIHGSCNYYWADSSGIRLSFNELDFPDFDSSVRAFDNLKLKTPKIHPVPNIYRDIDSIKGEYLISNTERAFALWKQPLAKNVPFDDFCEYLLPYRISVEPMEDWQDKYANYWKPLMDSIRGLTPTQSLTKLTENCIQWFMDTYNHETRKEPLPRLSALQLLFRKKGACEDFTDLGVFAARILGIPATVEYVPYWATSTATHFFDVAFVAKDSTIPYECLHTPVQDFLLPREPGKVLRTTYGKQPNVLATIETADNIPQGFLRTLNYKDVTNHYWQVQDVGVKLFPNPMMPKTVYACVLNGLEWRPIWWGKTQKDSATFINMSKGAVYMPMYYQNGKMKPAGYPTAVGYNHTAILLVDTLKTRTIQLPEQDKYLIYRPNKKYTLYYWNNSWKKIATQTTSADTHLLSFDKVPKNALLLMVPEYSQKKERPFIITEEGKRVWW